MYFNKPKNKLFHNETDNNYLLTTEGTLKTTNCPYCKTGKLVMRQKPSSSQPFLGCTHYPNCSQTFSIAIVDDKMLCTSCKSGFMTKKKGPYSNFLGRTNYPKCKNMKTLK
ncbi:topoisomerase DNA-binding C4 zinc finger domain-containing protein [Pedobacter sp. SL55]|uniref:topoisomerase DNA-binding C4 zinc finger domain-containing protein n=1 Tax=Pedobacter sp. SL55 TaxID=2995161 RepID=UPI003B63FF9A